MKEKKKQTTKSQKLKEQTRNRGITLIALVITIIVLLILAGVSIAMLTGQNGILTQANNAKIEQSHGSVREGIALAYNEYQIEINTASSTKLASTETVTIQGRKERILANTYSSFLDFLVQKGYATLDENNETTGIINVQALTGGKQALGNGTDTDVYKIEEENGNYVVNYYEQDGQKRNIWEVSNNENEGDSSRYSVESIITGFIGLKDLQTNNFTTFSEAYIIRNGEKVDISICINDNTAILVHELRDRLGIEINRGEVEKIIIVKDGKEYIGELIMDWVEPE